MTDKPDLAAALRRLVEAVTAYSPREDHNWRCEYRTEASGWVPGGPPVIRCECGFDALGIAVRDAQAALAAPSAEGLDVERLARAMRAYDTGRPVQFDFDSDTYRREAARLAREYDALADPQPETPA